MLFIVGLGNPGRKFKNTRHNIGFRAIDFIQKDNSFPKFKLDKKSRAEISRGVISGQEILLAKPQTFMNNSGFAVRELSSLQSRELSSLQLVVIHDDFDLVFGEVKMSENAGSAGHRGVESIIQALGANNFKRIRIGIRPIIQDPHLDFIQVRVLAEDFVLKKFSKAEEKLLAELLYKIPPLLFLN